VLLSDASDCQPDASNAWPLIGGPGHLGLDRRSGPFSSSAGM